MTEHIITLEDVAWAEVGANPSAAPTAGAAGRGPATLEDVPSMGGVKPSAEVAAPSRPPVITAEEVGKWTVAPERPVAASESRGWGYHLRASDPGRPSALGARSVAAVIASQRSGDKQ